MKLKQDEPPGAIAKQATQEVQDLISARWVADMIGVAAELQLADFINTGAKTAEEIAKTKGLHATSLYRLLRALASCGIFAEQEDGTFADIGGSQGFVLSLVLPKYPDMRGILFDLPAVVEGAPSLIKSYGLESRIDVKSGNFFESIPSGADAYLLKHTLHNWSDEDCLHILKNIYAVAEPGTKLLIVDAVIGARNEHDFAKILDIQMLVHLRGKERTQAEWKELLHAAGFRLAGVVPTSPFAHVMEAVRIK